MNMILLFLLLMGLVSIIWHFNFVKNENELHISIVNGIEEKIELEVIKQNDILSKYKINHVKIIDFKLSIIKQQIELLSVISNQK